MVVRVRCSDGERRCEGEGKSVMVRGRWCQPSSLLLLSK